MQDIDDFINDLMKIEKNNKKAIKMTNKKILSDGLNIVVDKTPVDTGTLRGDWNFEVDGNKGVLFNDLEYAPHVEYGHRLRGKDGKKRRVKKGYIRKDGKKKGSMVEGVYMLRDTMNELDSKLDKYQKYYIKRLGLEDND